MYLPNRVAVSSNSTFFIGYLFQAVGADDTSRWAAFKLSRRKY
jgi:hypothetical protein